MFSMRNFMCFRTIEACKSILVDPKNTLTNCYITINTVHSPGHPGRHHHSASTEPRGILVGDTSMKPLTGVRGHPFHPFTTVLPCVMLTHTTLHTAHCTFTFALLLCSLHFNSNILFYINVFIYIILYTVSYILLSCVVLSVFLCYV